VREVNQHSSLILILLIHMEIQILDRARKCK